MMTQAELEKLASRCSYPGFELKVHNDGTPYLQISFSAPCNEGGPDAEWKSRKWKLSPHMTPSEVVRTAYKAVLAAVEHEAAERFKFDGRAVYGPHVDVLSLWNVANFKDVR